METSQKNETKPIDRDWGSPLGCWVGLHESKSRNCLAWLELQSDSKDSTMSSLALGSSLPLSLPPSPCPSLPAPLPTCGIQRKATHDTSLLFRKGSNDVPCAKARHLSSFLRTWRQGCPQILTANAQKPCAFKPDQLHHGL